MAFAYGGLAQLLAGSESESGLGMFPAWNGLFGSTRLNTYFSTAAIASQKSVGVRCRHVELLRVFLRR